MVLEERLQQIGVLPPGYAEFNLSAASLLTSAAIDSRLSSLGYFKQGGALKRQHLPILLIP